MPSLAQVLARPSAFSSAGERSSRLLGGDMPPQNPNFAVTGIAHLQGESICRAPQRARPFAPVTEFASKPLLQRRVFRRRRRRSVPILQNSLLFSLLPGNFRPETGSLETGSSASQSGCPG